MHQNKHPRPGRIGFALKFLLLSVCFWSMTAFAQLSIEVHPMAGNWPSSPAKTGVFSWRSWTSLIPNRCKP